MGRCCSTTALLPAVQLRLGTRCGSTAQSPGAPLQITTVLLARLHARLYAAPVELALRHHHLAATPQHSVLHPLEQLHVAEKPRDVCRTLLAGVLLGREARHDAAEGGRTSPVCQTLSTSRRQGAQAPCWPRPKQPGRAPTPCSTTPDVPTITSLPPGHQSTPQPSTTHLLGGEAEPQQVEAAGGVYAVGGADRED